MNTLKNKLRKTSDLNRKILKSGFWVLFGSFFSNVLLLVVAIYIANVVPKKLYGEFGILKSTINMFTVFAGLSLGLTATKYIAQFKFTDKLKTSRIIGLSQFFSIIVSSIVLLIFLIFSKPLAIQINAPHLSDELKIGGFLLFFTAINGVQKGILLGFEKFKSIAINSIIAAVISVLCQYIGAINFGLKGIILGFGVNFFILAILNFFSIKKCTSSDFKFSIFDINNFSESKVLLSFSIPAVLSGLMVSPVIWLTNRFLVNTPSGYEQMAVFDVALQWRSIVLFIPVALCQIALPMLSGAKNQDFSKILKKNLILNFVISSIIVLIIITLIPLFLSLYSEEYINAKYPMVVMLITTVFIAVNNVIGQAIASLDKMWFGFIFNLFWGIVISIFSYYFVVIEKNGALGLSYAYLVSYIFHTVVQFIFLNQVVKKKNNLNK